MKIALLAEIVVPEKATGVWCGRFADFGLLLVLVKHVGGSFATLDLTERQHGEC